MRFWRGKPESPGQQSATYKFRRRFAKLLIALGLIYIGAAIAAAGQQQPPKQTPHQFTTESTINSELSNGANKTPASNSVLAQNTTAQSSESTFIPQCTYRSIPYKTVYKTASWLDAGQTITTGGMDGEERVCADQFGLPAITTILPSLDKTVTAGTYVQPTYTYPGYINSSGDYIPSPNNSGDIIGGYSPTAICMDGTYSYSQHTLGTCSFHGGVSSWL